MALLPVEDAIKRLLLAARPIPEIETLPLRDAASRVLAAPLAARLTQPPFDASAMDGYALVAEDVSELASRLKVIGVSAAGHAFAGKVGRGEAVRIFTGAPVPEGADCVLLQEDARMLESGAIENVFSPEKGRHIRRRGQDFAEGEVLLDIGDCLDIGRLTLAAAMNHRDVDVFRKPLVGLIATGDELAAPGSSLGESQIVASSVYGVMALARSAGADVLDLGIVPDRPEDIKEAVARAKASGVDVLVTLGGASVGDHDLVQSTLTSLGMELDFWRIAMRPGKPLMVGRLGDIHVLGLPGNPVSSMVCGLLFLEPLVSKLAHLAAPNRIAKAMSQVALSANDHRQDYLRAELFRDPTGRLVARSFGKQDSSQMKIFANSGCLIVRPPDAPAIEAGTECEIMVLRDPR